MFCCTAVLETYSSLPLMIEGKTGEEWPEMIAQYSFIGCFARNIKHSREMWVLSLLGCKDFLDQHWCMKSCFSSARISELVLRYLKDGWREKIEDAASYRRFNNHGSSEGLSIPGHRAGPARHGTVTGRHGTMAIGSRRHAVPCGPCLIGLRAWPSA